MRRSALILCVMLGGCTPEEEGFDGPLPPVVASSKYVDYSTWEDAAPVCLDDQLAKWDRFIEETAAFLEVEPPRGRILYVTVPLPLASPFGEIMVLPDYDVPEEAWGCGETAAACYRYLRDEDRGLIFSKTNQMFHELAHAVDIPALGNSHPVLKEGLAQFVSYYDPFARVPEDFSEAFKEMVAAGPHPKNYLLAMHFVGSLIVRDGIEKFKELRAQLGPEDDLEALAAAYAKVYGEELDAGLSAMTTPIEGVAGELGGCASENVLEWTEPGVIETTVSGACGDGSFVGFGSGFYKAYVFDVAEAGMYRLTLTGPASEPLSAQVFGCPGEFGLSGYGSYDGQTVHDMRPGRHVVYVNFPPGPEMKGEARLKLELQQPL